MKSEKPVILPKKEIVPLLTNGRNDPPDCTDCGMTAYDTFYIDKKPYCTDCYLNNKYPGVKEEDLPDHLRSRIFD